VANSNEARPRTTARLPQALISFLLALAAAACASDGDRAPAPHAEAEEAREGAPPFVLGRDRAYVRVVPGDRGPAVLALSEYLRHFGYIPGTDTAYDAPLRGDPSVFDETLSDGIGRFQRDMGLVVSGQLDVGTLALLNTPRCGVPDGSKASAPPETPIPEAYVASSRWPRTNISYAFDRSTQDLSGGAQRGAVLRALASWSAVSPLRFRESTKAEADIVFSWESKKDHGDGFPFADNQVAHAFGAACNGTRCAPLSGDLHFNDRFNFVVGNGNATSERFDLETTALHELGHSLGLGHSAVPSAVMYAYAPVVGTKRVLEADDIAGIRALYPGKPAGCGNGVVDGIEECDDGDAIDDDECTNFCKKPRCGDGIVQRGEECDGANPRANGTCSPSCKRVGSTGQRPMPSDASADGAGEKGTVSGPTSLPSTSAGGAGCSASSSSGGYVAAFGVLGAAMVFFRRRSHRIRSRALR
jgi:uncharacterized protein (TIGR03382 family)